MAYALIEMAGHQYRVEEGTTLTVPRRRADVGKKLKPDRVLLVSDGEEVRIGTPEVKGAEVKLAVVAQVRGPKLRVFKYNPKENYKRSRGHRQELTELRVEKIALKGGE